MNQISSFNSQLGRDQFLQLLITQVQNQNPLEPMKNEEMMAQLAQFSTLEGIEKLNATFSSILSLEQLTQGSNLVGRTAVYQRTDGSDLASGVVDGVSVQDGKVQLLVHGESVPIDRVRGLMRSAFGA
jgi:flagellar basal-body rod modification protein FlgD